MILMFKEKWNKLAAKEKNLITTGIIIIFPALMYFYVQVPYNQAINDLKQQIEYQQEDLAWMQQAKLTIDRLKNGNAGYGRAKKVIEGQLIDAIDRSLKQYRINKAVIRLAANGENSISIQFKTVLADDLIKWLNYLHNRFGITVQTANMTRVNKENKIDSQIVLVHKPNS
jgi:type II secretory pathway component PulM